MNHYTATYNSPVGTIVIESDGEALTGLRFGEEKTPATLPVFDEVIRWLDDYFAGKQRENAVMGGKTDGRIAVQPRGTMFQQRVRQALQCHVLRAREVISHIPGQRVEFGR